MAPNTNIKSYLQQQHAVAAAAVATHQPHPISEQPLLARGVELIDSTPPPAETMRSYDEIDQIYDYIRGLAPLPDNLRRMKSIDFEQIEQRERQKRIHRQQQLQKIQLDQHRKLAEEKQRQRRPQYQSSDNSGVEQQLAGRKSAKQRQREQAQQSPAAPPLQPIRLTASEVRRPTVKRVESLKLKGSQECEKEAEAAAAAGTSSRPSYLISGSQFCLPRAQSTSSLANKRLLVPAAERALRKTSQRSQVLTSIHRSDLIEDFVDDDDDDDDESNQDEDAKTNDDKLSGNRGAEQNGSRASPSESADSSSSASEKYSSSSGQTSDSTSSDYKNKTAPKQPKPISSPATSRSQGQPAAQPAPDLLKEEHIYEQIPAHRDPHHQIARRTVEASETARVATVREPAARQRQRVPSQPTEGPSSSGGQGNQTEHSLSYSANLSANARHQQQVAALFASQQRQKSRDRDQHRQAAHMPMSQFAPQISTHQGPSSMPRSLAHIGHHHRLSMGNLHMLAPPIPMATLYTANIHSKRKQQPQLASVYQATNCIARSSSSSRVHPLGTRAPKLSPVELIARIQMPRAVSKRQVAPSSQPNATGPRPEPLVQHHRPRASNNAELRQNLACAYVWQQPIRASVKQLALPAPSKATEMAQSNKLSGLAKKRASGRRLTAIGIEQTFDMLGQRPVVSQQQQQLSHAQHRATLQAARANFFEPPNLSEAPLIDAEEEAQLNATSGPSWPEFGLESGQWGRSGRSEESADSNVKQNHRVAVSSVQAGPRRDSVSDLHSFSPSSSSSSHTSATSPQTTTSTSKLSDSSGEAHLKAPDAVTKTVQSQHQDGNLVPAGSFIKCHYGQAAAEGPATSGGQRLFGDKIRQTKESQAPKSKRLGSKLFLNGERLLSLIGLDTIGVSSGSSSSTKGAEKGANLVRATMKSSRVGKKQLSAQQQLSAKLSPRRTSAPPTPPTLATDFQHQPATASSRRRFSSSAANTVKERTMAADAKAPRPSLVCHYEHPVVEIAKLPSGQLEAKVLQRSKALAASKRRNAVEQQEAGSSGTTNSTGSYEAAIKNSAERRPVAIADENQQAAAAAAASRKLSAASSLAGVGEHQQQLSLIRVPKLSKQSHLLNRPLPRAPAPRAVVSCSSTSGGVMQSSMRHLAKSMQPASYTQTLQGRSQRNLTAINSQPVASALLDRYGTARSDPSSASQSRAAQLYLMSQQVRRPLVTSSSAKQVGRATKEQSPLSTNLDAEVPLRAGRSRAELVANQNRNQHQHQQQSAGSSASLKSPSGHSHNRLSSLGNIHPSAAVTTYTSSGISSTHLATNVSSSSSQRSKASNKSSEQLAAAKSAARRAASSSSNTLEGSSSWQQSGEERSEDDEIDMIDEPNGNSISPDIMRFGCHEPEAAAPRGHLKSFDERFSSKYFDQQLASSNDSLLESINFSGTLESRKKRQPTSTPTKTRS